MTRPHLRLLARSAGSLLVTLVAVFGTTAGSAGAKPAAGPHHSHLEMDLSANDSRSTMGEPEIAVNPRDPNNLFIDWNTFAYPPGVRAAPVTDTCGGMSSMNRGLTWQPAPVPLPTTCADAVAAFGRDGTLYAGGLVVNSADVVPCGTPGSIRFSNICILVHASDTLVRSTDSGRTWSAPIKAMGSMSVAAFPFAPGSGNPKDTFDRPWVKVDLSTNTVYASGANIADHERFVTASTDDGKSFGTIYAVDSPAYPSGGNPSGTIAAAHGVLAVAYTASSAPHATCPCVIFETSTNRGATFTRHVVPTVNGARIPRPFLAADPSRPRHFALTIFDSSGTENQVYTTRDSGRTWHGPTLVGEAPANLRFKPWIAFGPTGQLALVWRTAHGSSIGTSPYDVWAAVGRDRGEDDGAVFGAPVRVSSAAGTYPPLSGGGGDDFSFIVADNRYVHVGWGDSRNGPTQVWYGRIPLSDFERNRVPRDG
jgi:hypothetical protein